MDGLNSRLDNDESESMNWNVYLKKLSRRLHGERRKEIWKRLKKE